MTVVDLYDADYFDSMRHGDRLYRQFASVVPVTEYRQKRILDVGCGRGDLLKHLVDIGCRDLAGVDFSPDALELARGTIGVSPPGLQVTLKQGSVTQRDLYPDRTFDLAYIDGYRRAFVTIRSAHWPPECPKLAYAIGKVGRAHLPDARTAPSLPPLVEASGENHGG